MAANSQCFVEWKEQFVSKERGKRVVHYYLKDISGESILSVVGTERSVRHMFYVVADDFLKVNEAENSVNAGYRWRSRREVVNWLTSMLSKQHRQGENLKSPKSDHISGVGSSYQNRVAKNVNAPDIVWSGVAWSCSKQLKHFPAFCRNAITIAVQSFVFVMAEEEKRHLAYLEDMYEDRKGQKKVKVRWFHHNQEVQGVVTLKNPHPKEVFITPYTQVISVECVDGPAIVLTREHYEKCISILPEDLLTRVHLCLKQFKNNNVKPFKLSKLCGYFDQPFFSVLETDCFEDEESKRGRNCRVPLMAPSDSSSLDVKIEMLRRKLIPKYVKNRDLLPSFLKVNEKIEVLSQDSGIRGCWFRCTIMKVSKRQLKVQYDDLKDVDDSSNLEEWIPAFRLAIPEKLGMRCSGRSTTRPAHVENETNFNIEVGSPVDAWWSDGWWEGIVSGIGVFGDGIVQVYVPKFNIDERSREISSKDERIKQLETIVLEKSHSLTTLRSEVQSLQKKESFDAKELEGEVNARADELENQVGKLKEVISNQITKKEALEARINLTETKIADLNVKLEKLQRINEEQNVRIRNTERALQKAEEERIRVQFKAARYSRELAEAHESWLPPWLAVHLVHYRSFVVTHWNVYGRPALDIAAQKALETLAQVRKWAQPHIVMLHTKWIPNIKDQWLTFVTNMEPRVQILTTKTVEAYHESKKTLKPHITNVQTIVYPYIKETKKFTKPYINQLSKTLRPYIKKAHSFFKPYTKNLLRGYRRLSKITLKYHRQVRANIHEMLNENEFTRTLASNELVWVMASAIMVFPVMVLLSWLSTLFSKKPRRRTRTSNTSHPRRKAKRVHSDRAITTR